MFKSTTTQVHLDELRPGELAGRGKQSTDSTLTYSYLECKRAGAEFPPMKVTKDLVIIAGNHRDEMYRLFYKNENPLITVIMYDVEWDGASDEVQQEIRDMAFADNWHPETGKPLDFSGVKRNVQQHATLDRTDAQIMSDLGPTYGPKLVRRAVTTVRQAILQEKLNYARRLVKEGVSARKAITTAGLPTNTDPETLKDCGKRDIKVRTQQLIKAGTSCGNKWNYQLEQATDFFLAKSITQEALLSVVDAMDRAVQSLGRQASRSRRLALETIKENAQRLRHGQ